ncbi:MAG: hypothetical protein ACI9G1_004616 [Pirellulaceae bacterium]|jgi:hypothetical protein
MTQGLLTVAFLCGIFFLARLLGFLGTVFDANDDVLVFMVADRLDRLFFGQLRIGGLEGDNLSALHFAFANHDVFKRVFTNYAIQLRERRTDVSLTASSRDTSHVDRVSSNLRSLRGILLSLFSASERCYTHRDGQCQD